MDNVICVYDLATTGKCLIYSLAQKALKLSFYIPPALIKKSLKGEGKIIQPDNFKSSLFNPSSPDFSLFYSYNIYSSTFSYDNNLLLTLSEIIYSFCNDQEKKPYNDAKLYFESIKKYVNGILKRVNIKVDKTILLIPDSMPVESQEKLLSYFGKYETQLLWRSVAIFLGNEDLIQVDSNMKSIAILDEFSIGMLYSRLGMKDENHRIIPCHKLYKKADGNINTEWYSNDFVININEQIDSIRKNRVKECYRLQDKASFPDLSKGGVPQLSNDNLYLCNRFNLNRIPQSAPIVLVPENRKTFLRQSFVPVDLNESAFRGACKYVEYLNEEKIPYYDECESFSVVYQTDKEEIKYFELIEANSFLPAGRISQGKTIDKLGIAKGYKQLDIYLHLGDISKSNVQLRKYTQVFPLENSLNQYRPLLLHPSIMPGQGYAYVKVEDASKDKLFSTIELDFKNMELAFDIDNNIKHQITKDYLETKMERSFPPDVPPVKCRYKSEPVPYYMRRDLFDLVNSNTLENIS